MRAEGQVHNGQRAADLTLGARSRPRGCAGAARSEPGQDARAPPDCGASLRHDKVLDGSDALPDENAQTRQHRDGAARIGLQHETGDAYSGRCRIDGSDLRLRGLWQAHRAPLSKTPAFLHSLDPTRTCGAGNPDAPANTFTLPPLRQMTPYTSNA